MHTYCECIWKQFKIEILHLFIINESQEIIKNKELSSSSFR